MPKVLIADKLSPAAVAIFKERGVDADVKTGLTKEELIKIVDQYDGIAIRSATKLTADVLKAAKNLKVVGRAGIGVDNVDIPAATAAGVIVMNTPFGNSITTAEHAISLMLALARELPAANASTQAGKWEKNRFMGVEITGKVLGLIGAGNIGSIVADRAKGLKMRVIAYDPYLSQERANDLGIEKVELNDLLARADFITLHVPMTPETKNILSADAIAKTKKGVRIINCARGGLDRRKCVESGDRQRPCRRRGAGRVRDRTGQGKYPVRQREGRGDAASGRLHHRSAGECRAAGGRADFRLSADRRHHQCAEHAVHLGQRKRRRCGPGFRWRKSWAPSRASSPAPA